MEKAKLSINKTNKGKLTVEAHFLDSGKKMPVLNLTHPDIASLHEKEVEINRVGGQIEKIIYNGETIFSKSQTTPKKIGQMKNPTNTATAPYNFVPLNVVVVPSMEEPGKGDCTLNKYRKGKHTGHITLKIETKTPLYIRDALDINELQEKERLELEGKKYINPAFFSPARRIRIPGSSLRGMTRTMVEIVSYGKFGFFDDKRLYCRAKKTPYIKTIGEHIPSGLKDKSKIDITEAIFGNEKTFAGRVFFEDAFLENPTGNDREEERVTKILLGPKPTTFQHYLEQGDENLIKHPKNLAHYNSANDIRGNKLYWHKIANWAKDDQNDFNPKIDTKIAPVKSGKFFIGKIRFENLSDVELGALLFVLQLPENCCHKLGMGKPLGLGSVKITPTLFLSDRKTRYTDLFAEWETPIPESTSENQDITHFKKEFAKYVLGHIGKETATDPVNALWQVDRMNELKTMLNFEKKPDDDKTQYMPLGKFEARNVLPKPTELFNEAHT